MAAAAVGAGEMARHEIKKMCSTRAVVYYANQVRKVGGFAHKVALLVADYAFDSHDQAINQESIKVEWAAMKKTADYVKFILLTPLGQFIFRHTQQEDVIKKLLDLKKVKLADPSKVADLFFVRFNQIFKHYFEGVSKEEILDMSRQEIGRLHFSAEVAGGAYKRLLPAPLKGDGKIEKAPGQLQQAVDKYQMLVPPFCAINSRDVPMTTAQKLSPPLAMSSLMLHPQRFLLDTDRLNDNRTFLYHFEVQIGKASAVTYCAFQIEGNIVPLHNEDLPKKIANLCKEPFAVHYCIGGMASIDSAKNATAGFYMVMANRPKD